MFTIDELKRLAAWGDGGSRPTAPIDGPLRIKLAEIIARLEPGPIVFRLELPLSLAPPMNAYAGMPRHARAKLRAAIDDEVTKAKTRWHSWDMGVRRDTTADVLKGKIRKRMTVSGGHKRRIHVARHSSRKVDELSVDACGGKAPCDRLVIARILRDDSCRWLARGATWEYSRPGEGRFVVEVFELGDR